MNRRAVLLQTAGILAISLFLATRLGAAMLYPSILVPMACLSIVFVSPVALRLRKLIPSVLIAFGITALSLALGLAWTDAGWPAPAVVAKAAAVSLIATTLTAAATLALLKKIPDPDKVKWIMRGAILILYLIYRSAPDYFHFLFS
ncbi:hypothetical protein F183_A02120 [Bryobacterales bacterium F-183]|nr:hypothetical protein F183_A02120 [Bryobacterales bacterium F-183]